MCRLLLSLLMVMLVPALAVEKRDETMSDDSDVTTPVPGAIETDGDSDVSAGDNP
jgi:hypothetical protein